MSHVTVYKLIDWLMANTTLEERHQAWLGRWESVNGEVVSENRRIYLEIMCELDEAYPENPHENLHMALEMTR